MNRNTALSVFVAVVMMAFFAMADASFAAKPGFDDNEIRIAQFSPQSGPAAAWGVVARGSKFLFDLVNEEGGIHGRKINFLLRDTQYNPTQAMATVKELVSRQGVFAFTGGVSGAGCIAVKNYLDSNKVLWVTPGTAALNPIKYPPSRYRFHAYPLFEDEASVVTKYAVEKLGYKKVGFLYQDDVFGKAGLAGCKQRLAAYGMELVAELPAEPTSRDVSSQMLRFQQAGAEVVLMWVSPSIAVATLKTCASIDYKPQWIAFDGLSDYPLMYHITDGLFEGVITTAFIPPPDSDEPLVAKYREAAKRLAPEERWGYLFMGGIWFGEALVEALKRVGRNLSTEAVISELNKFENWKALGPPITWNESRRQGTDAVQIARCGPGGSHELLQDWTANDLATWNKK